MANDFLVSKWKIWYKSLDVNHDGSISREDVEEAKKRFSELHELDEEKRKLVNENFEKWWMEYIFKGKKEEISEQQFVDSLNAEFTADKEKFNQKMKTCFDSIFDVIDTNKDRSISEDEFLIAFRAYGHDNVNLDSKFFQAYNPKDGLVPLKDIVASWVEFTTSEDASNPGIVKAGFETGV